MNSLNKKSIKDLDVNGKTIVLHLDLNVVVDYENKRILNDRKLRASLPTINYLINHNAKIVILSHLGRIKTLADKQSGKYSLEIIVDELRNRVSKNVNRVVFSPLNYGETVVQMVNDLEERDILILENTRYCDISDEGEYVGLEWDGSEILGQFWGMLGDIFIDDAYGVAHRQLSSNYQTAKFAKKSALGFLIVNEINHLDIALEVPKSPYLALIGGNRVADKIAAIEVLCERADQVIIGGGLVYTFLYAQGYNVGLNLVERNMIDDCNNILEKYGKKILICFDFLCNNDFSDTRPIYRKIDEGLEGLYGLDIGKRSLKFIKHEIYRSKTILLNGPFGVIENIKNYAQGTTEICKSMAKQATRGAYTIICDIDTSSHAEYLGLDKYINFISTGGGASLSYIEEGVLDGLETIDNVPLNVLKKE